MQEACANFLFWSERHCLRPRREWRQKRCCKANAADFLNRILNHYNSISPFSKDFCLDLSRDWIAGESGWYLAAIILSLQLLNDSCVRWSGSPLSTRCSEDSDSLKSSLEWLFVNNRGSNLPELGALPIGASKRSRKLSWFKSLVTLSCRSARQTAEMFSPLWMRASLFSWVKRAGLALWRFQSAPPNLSAFFPLWMRALKFSWGKRAGLASWRNSSAEVTPLTFSPLWMRASRFSDFISPTYGNGQDKEQLFDLYGVCHMSLFHPNPRVFKHSNRLSIPHLQRYNFRGEENSRFETTIIGSLVIDNQLDIVALQQVSLFKSFFVVTQRTRPSNYHLIINDLHRKKGA